MKVVQELLVWLVLLIVGVVISQHRLPDRVTGQNVAGVSGPESYMLTHVSNLWANWQISDYGFVRVARSERLNATLVADPFTGKWHSLPRS